MSNVKLENLCLKVHRMAKRHAARMGYALQPDQAQLDYVLQGAAENWVKYGKPYCPCRTVTGDSEKDKENICPCKSSTEDVQRDGQCECGLFVRIRDVRGSLV